MYPSFIKNNSYPVSLFLVAWLLILLILSSLFTLFLLSSSLLGDTRGVRNVDNRNDVTHGYWELTPDAISDYGFSSDKAKKLFDKKYHLKFYWEGATLRARPLLKNTTGKVPDLIWNLQAKNGEYLYGWFAVPSFDKTYRCKLWKKQRFLYLRVYNPPLYTTYRLKISKKNRKNEIPIPVL